MPAAPPRTTTGASRISKSVLRADTPRVRAMRNWCPQPSGNVWEWTSPALQAYPGGKPLSNTQLMYCIFRGGAFDTQGAMATVQGAVMTPPLLLSANWQLHNSYASHLSHPARWSFLVRDDQLERAVLRVERRTIFAVSEQNETIGESRIQFREREEDAISISGFDPHICRKRCAAL